jgi:hypothetical protein
MSNDKQSSVDKELIPYEQALMLKQLGFDEPTNVWRQHGEGISGDVIGKYGYYNRKGDVYTAIPTVSQVFRWFRDTHNLNAQIAFCEYSVVSENAWKYTLDNPTGIQLWNGKYSTYEEAELECLKKLIDIINVNKTQSSVVDFIFDELSKLNSWIPEWSMAELTNLKNQANAMHVEEIINAYEDCSTINGEFVTGIQYYNNTYGSVNTNLKEAVDTYNSKLKTKNI